MKVKRFAARMAVVVLVMLAAVTHGAATFTWTIVWGVGDLENSLNPLTEYAPGEYWSFCSADTFAWLVHYDNEPENWGIGDISADLSFAFDAVSGTCAFTDNYGTVVEHHDLTSFDATIAGAFTGPRVGMLNSDPNWVDANGFWRIIVYDATSGTFGYWQTTIGMGDEPYANQWTGISYAPTFFPYIDAGQYAGVPEPATVLLLALGAAAFGLRRRFRK